MSVSSNYNIQVRNGASDLLVFLVAGVTQGHDDLHTLIVQLLHHRLQGLHLVQDDEVLGVGDELGVRGEVAHHTHRLLANLELGRLDGEVLHSRDQRVVQVGDDDFAGLVGEEGDNAGYTVIKLVVPEGHRVKPQHVVELGHDLPLELGVPDRALVEVPRVEPQHVLSCFLNISDGPSKSGQPTVTLPYRLTINN